LHEAIQDPTFANKELFYAWCSRRILTLLDGESVSEVEIRWFALALECRSALFVVCSSVGK
jgi:hypothetical protein